MYELELVIEGGPVVLKEHRAGSHERNRITLSLNDALLLGNHEACDIRLTHLPAGCVLLLISAVGAGLRLQVFSSYIPVYVGESRIADFAPMFSHEELCVENVIIRLVVHYIVADKDIFENIEASTVAKALIASEQPVRCSAMIKGVQCSKAGKLRRVPPFEVAKWLCHQCVQVRRKPLPIGYPEFTGNYQLLREVGQGGFGKVFEAINRINNVHSAVKIVSWIPGTGKTMARFCVREQTIYQSLSHPRIVRYYDSGCLEDIFYLATEFVAEGSVKEAVEAGRVVFRDFSEVLVLATDLFEGVAYLHYFGYVHRDLKPANVLLTQRDENGFHRLKISDFGFLVKPGQGPQVTASDEVLGTVWYMAPEVAEQRGSKDFAFSSDIYAAAATIYWVLAGQPPLLDPGAVFVPGVAGGDDPAKIFARRLEAVRKQPRRPIKEVCNPIFIEHKRFEEVARLLDGLLNLSSAERTKWTATDLAKHFQAMI